MKKYIGVMFILIMFMSLVYSPPAETAVDPVVAETDNYPLPEIEKGVCAEDDTGQLDIEEMAGRTGQEIQVPVRIQSAPNAVSSLGFQMIYSKTALTYVGYTRGELVKDFSMFDVYQAPLSTDAASTGRLKIGGYIDGAGISQGASGNVVYLKFKVVGSEEGVCYPLTLEKLVDDLKKFSATGGNFYVDNTPPEIFCPADKVIAQIDSTGTPADNPDVIEFLSSATAVDNLNGDVKIVSFILGQISFDAVNFKPEEFLKQKANSLAILPPGQNLVIFLAYDKCGNVSFCKATISIQPIACVEDDSGMLDIPGTNGKIGQEVWIPVKMQISPKTFSIFSFEVPYNPSVLEYRGYERGNLVKDFPLFGVTLIGSGKLIVEGMSGQGSPLESAEISSDILDGLKPAAAVSAIRDREIALDPPQEAVSDIVLLRFMVRAGMNSSCYPLKLENLTDDLAGFSATSGCFCIHNCNGDINGDGMVTPADALIVFRCYLTSCTDCPCCDVNGDGAITPNDALCVFQYYLGKPSCLDDISKASGSPGGFAVSGLSAT